MLDVAGPGDDQRVPCATEVGGDQLGAMEGRRARPSPPGVIHAVGLRTTQHLESAKFLKGLDLLGDGVGNLVLGEQFANSAVLPFGAGAVVTPNIKDDGIVAEAQLLESVDELADLGVGVFAEAGIDFHEPRLEARSDSGMLSHDGIVGSRGVSSASAGIQPSFCCRAKISSRSLSHP